MHELKIDDDLFKQILNAAGSAILISTPEGVIKYTNPRFTEISGYRATELIGRSPRLLNSGRMHPSFYREMWETILSGNKWRGRVLNKRKDGSLYWSMQSIAPVKDEDGNVTMYLSLSEDVTDMQSMKEQYRTLAFIDELTKLGNRRMFRKDLDTRIDLAMRSDDVYMTGLLNIDDFKTINDELGPRAGDKVLRQAATRLKETLKGQGDAYRLEGDEFAFLAGPYYGLQEVDATIEKLTSAFEEPLEIAGIHHDISFSIGTALMPTDSCDPTELMRYMEISRRKARTITGTCAVFFRDELQAAYDADTCLLNDLIQAIEEQAIFVVGQPIFNLHQRQQTGVEILLRWEHPRLGPINPNKIIKLAENYGHLYKLSVLIIDQVVKLASIFRDELGSKTIAINMNVAQVMDRSLIEYLCDSLDSLAIPHSQIIIEFTENDRFNFSEAETRQRIAHIKECGFKIAIDDFGSGFATFEFINDVDPDLIKIDRGITADIDNDRKKWLTMSAILALTEKLGVTTVVEGVETNQQDQILRQLSGESLRVQGYLYSKPTGFPEAFQADFANVLRSVPNFVGEGL